MNKRELRDAFGEWLHLYIWDWFATFTFNRAQSLDTAWHAFRNYINKVKPDANHFTVLEGEKNTLHVHSLLGNMGGLEKDIIEASWKQKHGIAQVLPYDKERGARYYMTKSINSDKVDWDIDIKNKNLIVPPKPKIVIPDLMEDL